MSRDLFGVELGLAIFGKDGDAPQAEVLSGLAVPGGDSAEQDAAPIPSLYFRSGTTEIYKKIALVGNAADWELLNTGASMDVTFREECVRVATSEQLAAPGTRDLTANPFTDDEGTLITANDFQVGDYIISGVGGSSEQLLEVTAVASPNITVAFAATPLAAGNNFVVKNYLPDSDGSQELQALVHFNGTDVIKLGDANWELLTGISLSGSYVANAGDVVAGDSGEEAIAKLDGNNDAQDQVLGTAQGATNLGTFTGEIISDNGSVKDALQELETALEEVGPVANLGPAVINQNSPTLVDTLLVDEYQSVEWLVTAHDVGTPGNVKIFKILGFHNGHSAADASSVKDQIFVKQRIGNFNLKADVVLNGSGAAQTIGLQLDTSDSSGIRYTVKRTETTEAL